MNKLFIDFHVIQTVPPSCVNRDDTGSPKTAVYGGVRRARVSSQSWKHAMRLMFQDNFDEAELGVRTKKLVELVAEKIVEIDASKADEAQSLAINIINLAIPKLKLKAKKKKTDVIETDVIETSALFFMSVQQAKNLAELALSGEADTKKAQAALMKNHGVEIALFGRMVADDPSLNVDASSQVAHSISTHAVANEYDYFTAVDDKSPAENAGAGMIGTVEFNSATLYRYATIAAHELFYQLAEEPQALAKAVTEFARAFITSMPTGKQNTFANRTLPDAVLVVIRTDQPINLVGAFEKPIKTSSDGGYKDQSVAALVNYANAVYDSFAKEPEKAYGLGADFGKMGEKVNLAALYQALATDMLTLFQESQDTGR